MFSKKNRFSFKNRLPKQTLNSPSFNVRYEKNDEGLKVAVVISKKVDKRAVIRNKIKREILECVRNNLEMNENWNMVFYVKQAVRDNNLEKEIELLAKKIK